MNPVMQQLVLPKIVPPGQFWLPEMVPPDHFWLPKIVPLAISGPNLATKTSPGTVFGSQYYCLQKCCLS